jgi:hypothetical protein
LCAAFFFIFFFPDCGRTGRCKCSAQKPQPLQKPLKPSFERISFKVVEKKKTVFNLEKFRYQPPADVTSPSGVAVESPKVKRGPLTPFVRQKVKIAKKEQ